MRPRRVTPWIALALDYASVPTMSGIISYIDLSFSSWQKIIFWGAEIPPNLQIYRFLFHTRHLAHQSVKSPAGEGGRKPAHTASREWGGGGDTRESLSLGNQGALESGEEGLGSTGTVAPQQFYPFIKNELRSLVI